MKFLVTGVCGQLGHDVMNEIIRRDHSGTGSDIHPEYNGVGDGSPACVADYAQMDITDSAAVNRVIGGLCPDVVIHCGAWTAVDLAEEEYAREKVFDVNVSGTENIARACRKFDCKMVYISTDYVFDGQGTEPWKPDCRSFNPLNVYGRTKLQGELAVSGILDEYYIVRTSWVFGSNGRNFVNTMLSLGRFKDKICVVEDQVGTPTYTFDLARLLVDMAETDRYGYYHASNEGGYVSWYEFAREIMRQAGLRAEVVPVTTKEYGQSVAARPKNSRLDKSKLVEMGFEPLPTWQDALARYLTSITY